MKGLYVIQDWRGMRNLWHWIEHLFGWNKGRIYTWGDGGTNYAGFWCEECSTLSGVHVMHEDLQQMTTTPEGKVKEKVKKLLKEFGAYQHWPVMNGFGAPTLDCVACHNERYFSIETKAPGQKPTERQKRTIAEVRGGNSKGLVFVIDGEECDDFLLLRAWLEGEMTSLGVRFAQELNP